MHEQTAEDAMAKIAIQNRKNKMTKKKRKGKLAEEMVTITDNFKQFKKEKEESRKKKVAAEAIKTGQKDAKDMIKELPARIKAAAEKGENTIYESCCANSTYGHAKLGAVAKWAEKQGFETEWKNNREAANEGGYSYDSFIISWE